MRFLILAATVSVITIVGVTFANQHALLSTYRPANAAAVAAASPELEKMLSWIIAGGYVIVFFGMMAEGPMVTAAAAFAASLGFFNVWVVLLLATLADLTADIGFYTVGYFSRINLLEKHGHRAGFTQARLKKMEHLLRTHPRKAILALKLVPGAALVGLPLVGAARVPVRTYASACLSFIFPSALLFTSLGYFFGRAYAAIAAYLQNAEYFIVFAIVMILLVNYFFKNAAASFARRLQPI